MLIIKDINVIYLFLNHSDSNPIHVTPYDNSEKYQFSCFIQFILPNCDTVHAYKIYLDGFFYSWIWGELKFKSWIKKKLDEGYQLTILSDNSFISIFFLLFLFDYSFLLWPLGCEFIHTKISVQYVYWWVTVQIELCPIEAADLWLN